MKLVKKISALLILMISFSFLITLIISCENEETEDNLHMIQSNQFITKNDGVGGSVGIGMKIHRGKKWSERRGVTPCTQGLGICSVKPENVSVEYKKVKITYDFTPPPTPTPGGPKSLNNRVANSTLKIVFEENVGVKQGDIFISSEDDDFEFTQDVLPLLGLNRLTVLADDYIVYVDNDNPYGYVVVNCIAD